MSPESCVLSPGLTLIEVLVSVVILAAGAVVVMQALAKVAQAQAIAEDRAQAYFTASAKMVEAELATAGGQPLPERDSGHLQLQQHPFDWTISADASADDPQVQAVTVAVGWSRGRDTYRQEIHALVRVPVKESP